MNLPYLQQHYRDKVVPALKNKLGYTNLHQVPRLEKIVITSCMGKAPDRKIAVDDAVAEITKITGQRPSMTFARKSVANFKLREGEVLGARVTLRGIRMWEFLHRFIHVTAPNIRDFRGISAKSFDGRGNYACGISDQSIFPEVEIDQIKRPIGFDLIFVTSAQTDTEGRELLAELGMPFRDLRKPEAAPAAETAETAEAAEPAETAETAPAAETAEAAEAAAETGEPAAV